MSGQRKQLDWRKIHDDLALRLAGFAATYEHDPVRVARLLEERTLRLAQAPAARGAGATLTRILVFTAGNERFDLGLEWVQEICPLGRIASLPGVSSALVGLINWRGEFVVVFDAARRLGSAPATQTSPRHAIVLRGGEPRLRSRLVISRPRPHRCRAIAGARATRPDASQLFQRHERGRCAGARRRSSDRQPERRHARRVMHVTTSQRRRRCSNSSAG